MTQVNQWIKDPANPIIRPENGTWKHDRCTSVSLVFKDGTCYLYHDGGFGSWWNGVPGHSAIGLLTCPEESFDGKTFVSFRDNPVLTWGRFQDFDRVGLQSPRVRIIDGLFYLYYVGTSYSDFTAGKCPLWTYDIGLAISPDGVNFDKVGFAPIVKRKPGHRHGTPAVFFHEGRWHLLTCVHDSGTQDGFSVQLTIGDTPKSFDAWSGEIVFAPAGQGAWDGYSIAAPAFCRNHDDGWYYMLYGGCSKHLDYPADIGLARSQDLRNWQRYPGNPIIHRGEAGAWDAGAIWITEFVKVKNTYFIYYEGRSAGRDRKEAYSPGATKQIGLITCNGEIWT